MAPLSQEKEPPANPGRFIAARKGEIIDPLELAEFVRSKLSGYKTPRTIVVTDAVKRAANGKADYGWAKSTMLKARFTASKRIVT